MHEKACIYARVSTSEQDVSNQISVLEQWARDRGFSLNPQDHLLDPDHVAAIYYPVFVHITRGTGLCSG